MKFILATHNLNKVREIKPLLPAYIKLHTLPDVGIDEDIPETADTLSANALQKVMYVYERLSCNCFADDTGLEVDALGGRPGVASARYAGEEKSADKNIEKLLYEMRDSHNRSAAFKTVIAAIINGKPHLFEGAIKGSIAEYRIDGLYGFGYDPVFVPDGYSVSFAQMSLTEKNALSHRAKAIKKFVEFLDSTR